MYIINYVYMYIYIYIYINYLGFARLVSLVFHINYMYIINYVCIYIYIYIYIYINYLGCARLVSLVFPCPLGRVIR